MAYLHRSGGEPVPAETIRALAALLGLSIPDDDIEALSTALRDQIASFDALRALDLTGATPPAAFDPHWHD